MTGVETVAAMGGPGNAATSADGVAGQPAPVPDTAGDEPANSTGAEQDPAPAAQADPAPPDPASPDAVPPSAALPGAVPSSVSPSSASPLNLALPSSALPNLTLPNFTLPTMALPNLALPNITLPQVDTSRLSDLAMPLASSAAMLSQMLSGMLGGQGGSGGVSPDAQRALQALTALETLYGSGASTPAGGSAPGTLGSGQGSGGVIDGHQRATFYQQNAAHAYTQLDTELGQYLTQLAGGNQAAATALAAIRTDVLARIQAIGADALTRSGRDRIDTLVMQALGRAHQVVGDSQGRAGEIAAVVDRLADRYLVGLLQSAEGAPAAAMKAVAAALAQVGKPYKFAASGPDKFDCSGLTKFAAAQVGVNLPHYAASQYANYPKVAPKDIRPGDLIFPPTRKWKTDGPGHVMMYIGNGKIVHASGPEGAPARIANLPSEFLATRWM